MDEGSSSTAIARYLQRRVAHPPGLRSTPYNKPNKRSHVGSTGPEVPCKPITAYHSGSGADCLHADYASPELLTSAAQAGGCGRGGAGCHVRVGLSRLGLSQRCHAPSSSKK